MLPIIQDVAQRESCDHPTSRPLLPRPAGPVIRVEEKSDIFIAVFAALGIWLEAYCVSEPGRMYEVPFCRTCAGPGLCRRIGLGKGFPRPFARTPHLATERM